MSDRAHGHMGRDAVDSLAARVPATTRTRLVRGWHAACVPTCVVLLAVVPLRCVRSRDLCRRGRNCTAVGRSDRGCDRHVGDASSGNQGQGLPTGQRVGRPRMRSAGQGSLTRMAWHWAVSAITISVTTGPGTSSDASTMIMQPLTRGRRSRGNQRTRALNPLAAQPHTDADECAG
jgi:hypothetical protein